MSRYLGEPDYEHGTPERSGVLLVNLGTPEAPTPKALRRYLAEFLWDPRVVEAPRPLWWLALHLVILNIRPGRSARAYQRVWTPEGSPLLSISRRQHGALARRLSETLPVPPRVELAMRYGQPSVSAGLHALRSSGVRRVLVLPLYPQYSATTTASVVDAVTEECRRWRWLPELRFINQYHDHPAYVAALADRIRHHWEAEAPGERLLFSFHGIPQRYFLAGDPYHCQCHKTARLVAEALGLADDRWQLVFQSRFGREAWLQPYADQVLRGLPGQGIRSVDIVCPGFAADCLETLDEIAMENRQVFIGAGGERYTYIPALNDAPEHIEALAGLVRQHMQGWPDTRPDTDPKALEAEWTESRRRALAAGAPR